MEVAKEDQSSKKLLMIECTRKNEYVGMKKNAGIGKENGGSIAGKGISMRTLLKDCTNMMSIESGKVEEGTIKRTKRQ